MSFGNNLSLAQLEAFRKRYEGDKNTEEGIFSTDTSRSSGCLHLRCSECNGTGVRKTGGMCIHGVSCSCPNCTTS